MTLPTDNPTRARSVAELMRRAGLDGDVARGGLGSLALKVFNVPLAMGCAAVLARLLGPAGYGAYSYALAIVQVPAVLAQLGMPVLLVRELAGYRVREQWGLLTGLLRYASWVVLGASLLFGAGAYLLGPLLFHRLGAAQLDTFRWALLLVPLLALGATKGASLRGLGLVLQGQLHELGLQPLSLSLLLLCGWLVASSQLDSVQAMLLNVAATALTVGAVWALARSARRSRSQTAAPSYETPRWRASTLPLTLYAVTQMVLGQTDLVALGLLRPPREVGVYRVVVLGAGLVPFGMQAFNVAVAPHVARLHAAGDVAGMQRVVRSTARSTFLLTLPVALALLVCGSQILSLVFGPDYAEGSAALRILVLGQLASVGVGSVALLLNMTGHESSVVRAQLLAALLHVALCSWLVPRSGMLGAAASAAIAMAIWNVILWWEVKQRLGIRSTAF
jgi:O-antigen/teichoic acid export membrane protein